MNYSFENLRLAQKFRSQEDAEDFGNEVYRRLETAAQAFERQVEEKKFSNNSFVRGLESVDGVVEAKVSSQYKGSSTGIVLYFTYSPEGDLPHEHDQETEYLAYDSEIGRVFDHHEPEISHENDSGIIDRLLS